MDQNEVFGTIRHLLTTAGGGLVADGLITSSQLTDLVGGAIVVLTIIWSIIQKKQQKVAIIKSAVSGSPQPATLTSPVSANTAGVISP